MYFFLYPHLMRTSFNINKSTEPWAMIFFQLNTNSNNNDEYKILIWFGGWLFHWYKLYIYFDFLSWHFYTETLIRILTPHTFFLYILYVGSFIFYVMLLWWLNRTNTNIIVQRTQAHKAQTEFIRYKIRQTLLLLLLSLHSISILQFLTLATHLCCKHFIIDLYVLNSLLTESYLFLWIHALYSRLDLKMKALNIQYIFCLQKIT